MLSRSARAAYRSAGTLPASALCPSPTELLWVELNEAKSALHDLGKLSKFAKLALTSPDELPVEGKERMSKYVTEGEKRLMFPLSFVVVEQQHSRKAN